MQMKVSILVPVFRAEHYIERCARSLFEQSYSDLEYVFVDDCSPDNSIAVLRNVMEDYPDRADTVKIINHDTNRGVAAARNTLLDNATGDFVSWVDSDDWLEPNAIELLAQKQIETDADIVSGNIYQHYADEVRLLKEDDYQNKAQMLLEQLKDTWNNNTFIWGRLFRRSLFEDYHLRCIEGCNYAEDRYQVVRFSYYADKYAIIDSFVYNYENRDSSSITRCQRDDVTSYLKNQYQHLLNWIGIRDFFSDKNEACYQLAVLHSARLLKLNLDWALKFKTKKEFLEIIALIEENEDCMRELGWKKKGMKGAFLHNYQYMWMKQLFERAERTVGKKIGVIKNT